MPFIGETSIRTGASSAGAADLGDDPGQSAMFDRASSSHLTYTPSTSPANSRKTWTLAFWCRRASFGTTQILAFGGTSSNLVSIYFDTSNRLVSYSELSGGATNKYLATTRRFRDTAWYHVTIRFDTTQATEADRHRIYINGVQETAFDTETYRAQNDEPGWNSAAGHLIASTLGGSSFFDGTLCAVHNLANQSLDPTSFGRFSTTHPTVFVPITTTATFGTNDVDFHLAFATNTHFGDDTSGNGNDFTDNNMGTDHQVSDTPYNVHLNLSGIAVSNAGTRGTLADGGMVATLDGSGATKKTVYGSLSFTAGKFYVEAEETGSGLYPIVGIARGEYEWHAAGAVSKGCSYQYNGNLLSDGSSSAFGATFGAGDRIGVAIDADNGKIFFSKNGTYQASGNPVTGANPAYTFTPGEPLTIQLGTGGGSTSTIRIYVEESDWGTAAPTGYSVINRANLPAALVTNPEEAFITTKATETNIVSSMASARSDWGSDYVDILKNSSSIEAWLYRFGADSSNEFVAPVGSYPSYSATYQANSTLSGSDNWQGHSIRIGAEYLTAAGTIAHTNGAATTITHNLATDRYCVLLFEQGTTKDVWFHHPDFSSGNLLKFVKDEALAASTQITNIGSNSCDIGSGAATGTYSYFIFADGGIASMGKYTGNGNADGPFIDAAQAPGFFSRRSGGARNFWSNHAETPGYNENDRYTRWNDVQAEGSSSLKIDLLSTGIKIRDTYADQNTNAEVYYWFSFGQSAIGGGIPFPNAR
jgi:hypothetical protein